MNADTLPRDARDYLRTLERALSDMPAAARATALDDVRAHIEDALAAGRSPAATLAGLGAAESVAERYRDELGLPALADAQSDPDGAAQLGARILHLAAVVLAVLSGAFVTFLLPIVSIASTGSSSGTCDALGTCTSTNDEFMQNLAQAAGPGVIALCFAPVLLAVLPLVLSRWQLPIAIANAVLITGFAVLGGFTIGAFFAPLAVMMWAAAIVPWRLGHGLRLAAAPVWRIAGAALVALPALLMLSGLMNGTLIVNAASIVVIVVLLGLAAGFATRFRVVPVLVALVGLALLILTMVDPGMLAVATWWAGGLYLVVGLSAFVAWGRRSAGERTAR